MDYQQQSVAVIEDTGGRKRRPASLSLTVAGEWLQRVKSLGRPRSQVAVKRQPLRPLTRPSMTEPGHSGSEPLADPEVPGPLQEGTWMTKVSGKKQKKVFLRVDADMGQIIWQSKQPRIIPIECIKEMRSGPSTRLHRHHFQLAQEYETLWLTIIYILDGHYKILHLIAPSEDIFRMWDTTLRKLHAYRLQLMTGLGNMEERQRVWEKQYWKGGGGDIERDQKLTFEDVEKLCRRLNINSPKEDLLRWFKQADVQGRRYLDFEDFRSFVRLLKTREEILKLFNHLKGHNELFDFKTFARFMREEQKSTLPTPALLSLFEKYSVPISTSPSPPSTPHPSQHTYFDLPLSERAPTNEVLRTITPDTLTTFLLSPDNAPFASPSHSSLPPAKPISATNTTIAAKHDMTQPLSSYFISSSHNTYLIGHQLVGSSTVEGYIRALLAGCRSVEIDIFDGSGGGGSESTLGSTGSDENTNEPMVFHGHTLTSKVPLRQICQAIMKYGFIASPYPIIISAENHCSVQGQERMARIMIEEFGAALVKYPTDGPDLLEGEGKEGNWKGKGRIERLPSPEELKGRILLKTKNLMLGREDSMSLGGIDSESDPSSSASESEFIFSGPLGRIPSLGQEPKKKPSGKPQRTDSGDILIKASNVLQRVRTVGRSSVSLGTAQTPQTYSPLPTPAPASAPSHAPAPVILQQSTITSPPLVASPASFSPAPTPIPTPIPIPYPPPSSYPSSPPLPSSASPKVKSPVGMGLLSRRSSDATSSTVVSDREGAFALVRRKSQVGSGQKPKMSMALLALLVYTVGVKCRGFRRMTIIPTATITDRSASPSTKENVKGEETEEELYAPEHMFSLSENSANKILRTAMFDLIRHTEGHLVRVYPRGTRMRSTNFVPHRYWSGGAQLVAINWQTFDLGYIINHAMFQRNARCGYVLKPPPLRYPSAKEYSVEKWRKASHVLNVVVISAQQLPKVKVKDGSGHQVDVSEREREREGGKDTKDKEGKGGGEGKEAWSGGKEGKEGKEKGSTVDPYVEVSVHIPEWTYCTSPTLPTTTAEPLRFTTSQPKIITQRTPVVKSNGFNPVWNQNLKIPFDCVNMPGMLELIFVRFVVRQEGLKDDAEPLAVCCVSLGELQQGYRHLPLHDAQLSQYLFSTLFVKINVM